MAHPQKFRCEIVNRYSAQYWSSSESCDLIFRYSGMDGTPTVCKTEVSLKSKTWIAIGMLKRRFSEDIHGMYAVMLLLKFSGKSKHKFLIFAK